MSVGVGPWVCFLAVGSCRLKLQAGLADRSEGRSSIFRIHAWRYQVHCSMKAILGEVQSVEPELDPMIPQTVLALRGSDGFSRGLWR